MLRKFLTSALCVMVALSGVTVTKAQEPTEQPVEETTVEETTVEETTVEETTVETEETEVTVVATENELVDTLDDEEAETPEEVITTAKGTQKVYLVGDDWGVAVSKTILSLDKAIDASSVSIDKFVVKETKQWYGGVSTFQREILNAYISDANGNVLKGGWGPAPKSSKYITIEMYVSPSEGSAFVYSGSNNWCDPYELHVTLAEDAYLTSGEEKITTLDIQAELDLEGSDKICPQLNGVQFYGAVEGQGDPFVYTASGEEVLVPYAYYEPANDGHKNPIVVWNHGGGGSGSDPQIVALANESTAL